MADSGDAWSSRFRCWTTSTWSFRKRSSGSPESAISASKNDLWVAKTPSAARLLAFHGSVKAGIDGDWVRIVGWSIVSALKSQRDLTLENVALKYQLMVLQRQSGRLRFNGSRTVTGSSGSCCTASGRVGTEPSLSSNQPPS